ncbi:type II toxin-antitoxin system RnlA family toxin [Aneurinibacillus aneurinilyticus]|uniref:type II toxin-antitoxin system RnlA family toxin n=1 Tax=Aneurinibacillus aneurinilyticus TaxID=1391 RepID=UPI0035262B5E
MKLSKLRYDVDSCVAKLKDICIEMDMEFQLTKKSDHLVLRLIKPEVSDGIIRLYDTKKNARTLDGSVGNTEINDLVLTMFSERHCQDGNSTIESKWAIYELSEEKFDKIRNVIEEIANKNDYSIDEKAEPQHAYYMIEVKHKTKHDKITVTQFNKGNLMIQGRSWEVWDEICNSIDEVLDVPVEDMLLRFMKKQGESVSNIITFGLKSKGQVAIKQRLGQAYEFLYEHDQKLITSSQCMLLAGVDYGDYYCYVAPCLRVIEGYLKKVIADLGFYTETEIEELDDKGRAKFNFGWVFNGLSGVQPHIKTQLGTDTGIVSRKEAALVRIYTEYKDTRNPLQHDGPPVPRTVESYDEAQSIFDQLVGIINTTHRDLF